MVRGDSLRYRENHHDFRANDGADEFRIVLHMRSLLRSCMFLVALLRLRSNSEPGFEFDFTRPTMAILPQSFGGCAV